MRQKGISGSRRAEGALHAAGLGEVVEGRQRVADPWPRGWGVRTYQWWLGMVAPPRGRLRRVLRRTVSMQCGTDPHCSAMGTWYCPGS